MDIPLAEVDFWHPLLGHMSFTKNDVWSVNYTLFFWAKIISFIVSFCQGLSLNLTSASYHARKLKFMVLHTPSPFQTIYAKHSVGSGIFFRISYQIQANWKIAAKFLGKFLENKNSLKVLRKCGAGW